MHPNARGLGCYQIVHFASTVIAIVVAISCSYIFPLLFPTPILQEIYKEWRNRLWDTTFAIAKLEDRLLHICEVERYVSPK